MSSLRTLGPVRQLVERLACARLSATRAKQSADMAATPV